MIRHCVMFRWKPDVGDDVRKAIADGLDRLGELDYIESYRHGADLGLREGNWDYVVVGDFADEAAYRRYSADPVHVELVADLLSPNISDRAAVQYEFDR